MSCIFLTALFSSAALDVHYGYDVEASALLKTRNQLLTKKQTETVVNILLHSITEALSEGDKVELRGFGSFRIRNRHPREGRNPKRARSQLSGQASSRARCEVAIRFNMFHRPTL